LTAAGQAAQNMLLLALQLLPPRLLLIAAVAVLSDVTNSDSAGVRRVPLLSI
jgi:hypothetical protein